MSSPKSLNFFLLGGKRGRNLNPVRQTVLQISMHNTLLFRVNQSRNIFPFPFIPLFSSSFLFAHHDHHHQNLLSAPFLSTMAALQLFFSLAYFCVSDGKSEIRTKESTIYKGIQICQMMTKSVLESRRLVSDRLSILSSVGRSIDRPDCIQKEQSRENFLTHTNNNP